MVDAAASLDTNLARRATTGKSVVAARSVAVFVDTAEAMEAYRGHCAHAVYSPAASPAWVGSWVSTVKPDFLVATLSVAGIPAFALALEVVSRGPFRLARLPGGHHANGNFAPLSPAAPRLGTADLDALVAAIRAARPDIDLLALDRNVRDLDGLTSPLARLPSLESPNVSLAVDLDGGFDALLDRSSGKRKRKKHRSQSRKFEAAGGFRRIEAQSPAEVATLLDTFFAMKQERFRKMGIADVFGEPEVRAFFRKLFTDSLAAEPKAFVLHGLEVGGKHRAITGSSRSGKRLICEFGAIVEDELANASPGDFLFFENIREACADSMEVYDFSVGDELYKRLWCDMEARHFDVVVPLTAKGVALAGWTRLSSRIKAFVKSSPLVWKITKALRRRAATTATPAED